MKKLIVCFLMLTSFVFSQQLNYTWGLSAVGVPLTGVFTSLDSTGVTSYSVYIDLNDYYPGYDINPAVYDSVTAIASSDQNILFTLYYLVDVNASGDSTDIDVDVSSGLYTSTALTMASTAYDPTPVNNADLVHDEDIFGHINVYTETGKLYPPEVVRVTFDVDPTAHEVSAGTNLYYRIVYPQIYEVAREKIITSYESDVNVGD